jgi:signal transduction histidine kinase
MRWSRLVAAGLAGITLAVVASTGVLLATQHFNTRTTITAIGLISLGTLITFLGVLVTRRVRGNVVGLLLTWVGFNVVYLFGRDVYYRSWLADHTVVPLSTKVVAALDESGWWLFAATALLLLYFPDGHVPSRRWRAVPALIVGAALVTHVTGAWASEPFVQPMQDLSRPWGASPWPVELLSLVANLGLVALGLVAGASLVVRFRRASGPQRLQLKWLSLAGVAAVLYPVACGIEILITGGTDVVAGVLGVFALVALPVSVAVAMLRHDLYDVDRVLADTISYVVVVVVLVATYILSALALGLMLGRDSAPAAAGATAICALLLAPLRTRLRRSVDRRLFPPRRAALQAIEDLQHRVHTQGAQPEELESVLRTALRDPQLRVGMLVPGMSGFVDASGDPVADNGLVPVTLGGVQIGVLSGSDATGPGVLRVVASACASLVEVTRLRAELAGALREVEASRTRLVQVGDAERRRLERDLHDGAQQRLVSLGMAMRLAQRRLPQGGVDVNALLDQGVAELATAIAELRQIAHGLRPTSLDDGLHAALSALTGKLPIPVHLDVVPEPLDDDVATTAYFVAAEAITNAAKYANASAISVRVAQCSAGVEVKVQDDGIGGAAPRTGSGLAGLADRVAAIGGSIMMTSPVGAGTTIEAVLPCGS